MLRYSVLPFVAAVLITTAHGADPVISEFMASNQNSITDEDGQHSDWIEIRNPGSTPVNLAGWILADSSSRWTFPTKTLPAGGHLIVFASGKDRTDPNGILHTNFSLSAGGEYLGLIKPDGVTVSNEFAPYPQQYPDVSYGLTVPVTDLVLVDKGTPCRAFVPTNTNGGSSLGTTWRQPPFDDSTWPSGSLAVGYFQPGSSPDLTADLGLDVGAQMYQVNPTVFIRIPFTVTTPTDILQLKVQVQYDDGFAAFLNGTFATSKNSPVEASLGYTSPATTSHSASLIDEIDITSVLSSLQAGSNVLAIQGLNTAAGSTDLFILPKLIAKVASNAPPQIGYFATATPGTINGGNETLLLPQTITFSRASGTFQSTFPLTLSGATAGQEIRYVIANASGTGGIGANIAEPTSTSTLYTGPINIDQTKIIRAAVFLTGSTQKGQTSTAQYLLLETGATNNTSNFTSNLPIVVLNDHGFGEAVDSGLGTYTTSMLHVFEPVSGVATLKGPLNDGVPNTFSRAGFRIRGSSSAGFPKKSYGMELWNEKNVDTDRSLIGLAADSDWILNGPYLYDDTYIHNAFIYEVSRRIGRWAPRTKVCEVFIDKNGGKLDYQDYNGIYMMTEKIKSNSDRLDITSITPADASGANLTGGYIFKIDRADADEVSWHTSNGVPHGAATEFLVLTEPDPDVDTTAQINYLQGYVQQFDTTVYNEAAGNFATRNYRNFIDVPSFIDHHILNSLAFNVDALRLSAYFYKDRSKKINAGPIWDFDRSLGSDDGRDANPQTWNNITYFFDRDWWGQLFKDPDFVQAWVDRWWELRATGGPFDYNNLSALSIQMGNEIGNTAAARDAVKWTEDAPDSGQQYLNEITKMNNWLNLRLTWIDSQLPTPASASVASSVVSPGTSVSLSGSGVIRYTVNGTDPRPPGGSNSSSALTYSGPLTINQTTVVTVRPQITRTPFPNGAATINWGPPKTFVYLVNEAFAVAGDIAISEINYHPLGPSAAESVALPGVTADDFEFIELRNVGARKVNTFELKFTAGFPFEKELKLSALSLNPGDFALVVKNRAAFLARYGATLASKIVGEWTYGTLSDGGEETQLFARDGSAIHDFSYNDSSTWPSRADGKGSSLEYIGPDLTNASYNLGANWRSSSEFQGSPGIAGLGPDNRAVINEVLANSAAPFVDAIELKNQTAGPLPIGGWYISDVGDPESPDDFKQFRIPSGTTLGAGQYTVYTEVDFNPNGAWNPNPGPRGVGEFAFDADHGDDAWLLEADGTGKILRFVDHVSFDPSRTNESFGRWPDATGSLFPMAQRTLFDEASTTVPRPGLGAPNSIPRVGPLIITEVQHSPSGGNTDLEFVEIINPTAQTISLNHWRLRGAVDFDFSTQTIGPAQVIVMVPFSPTDTAKVNAFTAAYNVTGPITLIGPWSSGDHLGTTGQVTLYRAGTPPFDEPFYFPQTVEDETAYDNGGAWPDATTGMSLNRSHPAGPGDLPTSWVALNPSPGNVQDTAPVANNDTLHVPINAPVSINVLPNDTDADGDTLFIASVGSPAHGTATTDGKTITYTSSIYDSAPANTTGEDTFTYVVADGFGGTATGTVSLVNTRPVAANDTYHLRYTGSPLVLNVLANDSDAENDAFALYGVSNLSTPGDSISIVGNTLELTPANGTLEGNHSFTYTIRDQSGGFASGNVAFANAAPNVPDVSFHGPLNNGSFTIDVLANATDSDNDPLRILSVNNGAVITDNKIVITPPGGIFQGSQSFTFSVTDDAGGVSNAMLTVSNAGPNVLNDTLHVPLTGGDLVLNPLANDTDPDGDPLTLTLVNSGAFGTTQIVSGTVHYQPGPNYHGNDAFSYNVIDTNNVVATGTITLVNQNPVANADVGTTTNGSPSVINVRSNDTDGDGDSLTITGMGSAAFGTVTNDGTLVTYTPNSEFPGIDSFTYSIRDGYGGTATGVVTVKSSTLLTTSTAETGEEVPPAQDGSIYKGLQVPAIGDDGQVAWLSTTSGPNGRKTMIVSRRPSRMVARIGDQATALADGSKYTKLSAPVVDGADRVVFIGTVAGIGVNARALNNSAIFASESETTTAVVARLGSEPVGVTGARFAKFSSVDATEGETLFVAKIARKAGLITAANDTGVWAWDGSTTRLVARTGASVTTSAGNKTVASLSLLNAVPNSPGHGRTHRRGEVALKLGFTDKTTGLGIATLNGDTWELQVLTLAGNTTLTGTSWKTVGVPSLGAPGSIAALTTLVPAVAPAPTDTAVTLFDSLTTTEIAHEGSPSPIANVNFKSFTDPAASSEGEVAFLATLSGLGVTPANRTALIDRSPSGDLSVIARTGELATEASGASWKRFLSFAVASGETHGPVFLAQLGGTDVTAKNNLGLWSLDSTGAPKLVARTGQTITVGGVPKTLTKMTLLNALPPVQGSARSLNSNHQVAYLATFSDKSQAVLTAFVP